MNHRILNTSLSFPDCFQRLAVSYALRQIRALKKYLQEIRRAADGRCLHQARVASRRLRAALNMLPREPFGKKWKKWKRSVRGITRELGQARDKDVEIVFLQDFLKQTREIRYRPAISRMLLRSRQERKSLQPHVVKVVRDLKKQAVLDPLQEKLKTIATESSKQPLRSSRPDIDSAIRNPVITKMEAFLSFEPCLRDPLDIPRHHQMRIAAKRLRYTMEICAPLYGAPWKSKLNPIKTLQTSLGEIRDFDVRLEKLDRFQRDEQQRTAEYFGHVKPFAELQPGIEYLREKLQSLRQARFSSLVRLWQRLRQERFWEDLAKAAEFPCSDSHRGHSLTASPVVRAKECETG